MTVVITSLTTLSSDMFKRTEQMSLLWLERAREYRTIEAEFGAKLLTAKNPVEAILDPLRAFVSDKAQVKQYVTAKIGDDYNVPTIAVIDSYEKALGFPYPADCVIKPTHMSGEVIRRRAGSAVDFTKVRTWFYTDFYNLTREANYRHLRPRVIVEPYIFGQEAVEDYKVFCLNGRPFIIQVHLDRYTHHTQNLYTTDWEMLPVAIAYPIGPGRPKPTNLNRLLDLAASLSDEFNLVRIDLYTDGRMILVGEITNCHQSALGRFMPAEGEEIMSRILFGESGFSPLSLGRSQSRAARAHSRGHRHDALEGQPLHEQIQEAGVA
jgi:TupA-like ATPgrasp